VHLDLHGNSIGQDGIARFAQALHSNRSLRQLDLTGNEPSSCSLTVASCFVEALRQNDSIEILNVNFEKDNDANVRTIQTLLRQNRAGRRILRAAIDIPNGLWAHLLARCFTLERKESYDMVYYHCQENSALFQA
jgi:hypothetical protein